MHVIYECPLRLNLRILHDHELCARQQEHFLLIWERREPLDALAAHTLNGKKSRRGDVQGCRAQR